MIPRRQITSYKGMCKDIFKAFFSGKAKAGKEISTFQDKFSRYIGSSHSICVSSGRDALIIILKSMGLNKGDEIIVPSYTLNDLIRILRQEGYKPKFVDISDDFNMIPSRIEAALSKRAKVILATHLFGLPCDMDPIMRIARKHKLKVIEDCAHTLGAEYKGRKVGSIGDAAFFSLETRKIINTFGGGIITTSDDELFERCKKEASKAKASSFQISKKIISFYIESLMLKPFLWWIIARMLHSQKLKGLIVRNYKNIHKSSRNRKYGFTNVQAIVGLRQLDNIDDSLNKRKLIAEVYNENLPKNAVTIIKNRKDNMHIYYCYILRIKNPNSAMEISNRLISRGIDTGYGDDIMQNCSRDKRNKNTTRIAAQALELPMYLGLDRQKLIYITTCINEEIEKK